MKKEAKKAKAIERERQERLEARREHRRALQEQAAQNVKLVESAYRKSKLDPVHHVPNCSLRSFALKPYPTTRCQRR